MRMSTLAAVFALAGIVGWKMYTRPTAEPRRLAPEGTYFLTEYVSFPAQHGTIGVEPGEMVHLVRKLDAAGKWLHVVGRDGEFDVSADQLTADLDLAETIRRQDQTAQEDSRARSTMLSQQQAEQQRVYDDARAKLVQQNSVATAASSGVGGYNSRLHEPATRVGAYTSTYYVSSAPASGSTTGGSGGSGDGSSAANHPVSGGGAQTASAPVHKYTQDPASRLRAQGGQVPPTGLAAAR